MEFLTYAALSAFALTIIWLAFSAWAYRNGFFDVSTTASAIAVLCAVSAIALALADFTVWFWIEVWGIFQSATGI